MTSHLQDLLAGRLRRGEDKMCEGENQGLLYEISRESRTYKDKFPHIEKLSMINERTQNDLKNHLIAKYENKEIK